MTKAELINAVQSKVGGEITKARTEEVIDAVFGSIQATLAQGGSFTLSGFGTFKVAQRAARKGRNPRTGQEIQIAASRAVKFTPGKTLKEAVKG